MGTQGPRRGLGLESDRSPRAAHAGGLLVLMGGDEFRTPCEAMDKVLLEAVGEPNPRVVILPTAAARESPQFAARNGVRYFQRLGAMASPCMILNQADASNPKLLEEIRAGDVIYIAGGDPYFLVETLRHTLAWEAILQRYRQGKIVVG